MMHPEIIEQIEQYLLGKLSGDELRAFEQRLANEPDIAEEVELQRQVFDALRMEAKAVSFRAKLAEIEKRIEAGAEATVRNPKFRGHWLVMAAGLLLLAIFCWWIWNKNAGQSPTTPQALYAAHFSLPESISTAARRDADATATDQQSEADQLWNALWGAMESQYAQKDFAGALASLQQIQALDTAGEYASETFFYSALLQLKLGQAQMALEAFGKVAVGHSEDRDWYSALALLALDRNEEAKTALVNIVESKHPRSNEAAVILKKLH